MADKYLGQVDTGSSADSDHVLFNDVSDTTLDATGTPKKQTKADFLAGKANTSHTHTESQITDLGSYVQTTGDESVAGTKTFTGILNISSDTANALNVRSADNTVQALWGDPANNEAGVGNDTLWYMNRLYMAARSSETVSDAGSAKVYVDSDDDKVKMSVNGGAFENITTEEWVTANAGGGATLYDAVVAPSDGDYTTVEAAIDGGATSIFVRNGTYNESAATITGANISITGESRNETIINIGANLWSIGAAATDFTLQNLTVTGSSGGWMLFDGTVNTNIEGCTFVTDASGGNTPLYFNNSVNCKFIDNTILDDSTSNDTPRAQFSGAILVSGNTFRLNPSMDGVISVGSFVNFKGNYVMYNGGGGAGAFISASGVCNVEGNYLLGRSAVNTTAPTAITGITAVGVHCNIVGNFIYECKGVGIYLNIATACVVSGNSIDYSDIGIRIKGSDNIVTNNFHSSATTGVSTKTGVWIDAGGRNVVAHNNLQDNTIGILVDSSLSANQLLYNIVYNNSTPITDNSSGHTTPTVSVGNIVA